MRLRTNCEAKWSRRAVKQPVAKIRGEAFDRELPAVVEAADADDVVGGDRRAVFGAQVRQRHELGGEHLRGGAVRSRALCQSRGGRSFEFPLADIADVAAG